jgi:hypothetical protein
MYARNYHFIFRAICLMIAICSLSCVQKYVPVTQPNIQISGDHAIMTINTSTIAVRESSWTIEPRYLPDYYTTMAIRIQNNSRSAITISASDFAIIDEHNLQHDLVPIETVMEMMLDHPSLIPERFVIAAETSRENLARINEIRRNLHTRGFTLGAIHPGAIKEGVIFFPKLDNKNTEFTFVYKANEIQFKKSR